MARVLKKTSNNEYLFGFVDDNGSIIDGLLEGTGHIVLHVDGNAITSTKMSFTSRSWHTVALSYGKGKNFAERIIPPFERCEYLKEHFGTLYTSFLLDERVVPFLED
jgi:hypothetical protein